MRAKKFIIMKKYFDKQPAQLVQEIGHEEAGLLLLKEMWKEEVLDTIALIEFITYTKFEIVAKIEWRCKHPHGLQWDWNFNATKTLVCVGCKRKMEEKEEVMR